MKSNVTRGRRLVWWLEMGLLAAVAGCVSERTEKDAKEHAQQQEQPLTGSDCQKMLLEMDASQIPPGVVAFPPKDEPIKVVNADKIEVGNWTCNLKEKTFHGSFAFPDAPRHKFNEVRGVFQRTPEGKWVAKVTDSKSGG